jgi:hypothetical protein
MTDTLHLQISPYPGPTRKFHIPGGGIFPVTGTLAIAFRSPQLHPNASSLLIVNAQHRSPTLAEHVKSGPSPVTYPSFCTMVFRLPTHLESFLPPPSQQVPQSKPWRGTLVVNLRTIDKGITKELRVTAVETDGDKCVTVSASIRHVTNTQIFQPSGALANPPLCASYLRPGNSERSSSMGRTTCASAMHFHA